jgi:hypothetical protein
VETGCAWVHGMWRRFLYGESVNESAVLIFILMHLTQTVDVEAHVQMVVLSHPIVLVRYYNLIISKKSAFRNFGSSATS